MVATVFKDLKTATAYLVLTLTLKNAYDKLKTLNRSAFVAHTHKKRPSHCLNN